MRTSVTVFALLALLAQVVGCASTRMVLAADEMAQQDRELAAIKGRRIYWYTLTDGTQHAFRGFVRPTAGGDLLIFRPVVLQPTESTPEDEGSFTLPRRDVATLQVEKINKVRTALLAVGVPAALLFTLAATHHPQPVGW